MHSKTSIIANFTNKTSTLSPYKDCPFCLEYVSEGKGHPRAANSDLTIVVGDQREHDRWHVPLTEKDFENYPIEIRYDPFSEKEIDYSQLQKDTRLAIFNLYKALERDVLEYPICYLKSSITFQSIRSIVRQWNKNPKDALEIDIGELSMKDVYEKRYFGRLVSFVIV